MTMKSSVVIFKGLVAFSEYMNFKIRTYGGRCYAKKANEDEQDHCNGMVDTHLWYYWLTWKFYHTYYSFCHKMPKKSDYLLIIYLEPSNLLEGFSFCRIVVYLYAGATVELK